MSKVSQRVAVVLAGILAGMVLGIWLIEATIGGAAELWIGFHQAIRGPYTLVTPPLGALVLIASVVSFVASRHSVTDRRLLVAAVICLALGMVLTVAVHFPLNAEIDTWAPVAPPANWDQVHDRWLLAHGVRSVLALAAFLLLVATTTVRPAPDGRSEDTAPAENLSPTLP